jgi:hypothetical protein
MKLKLKKLEKLHQEATKGPYRWAKDGCLRAKDGTIMMDEHDGEKSAIKDGNFIKASYENLPKLISWAKRARPWLERTLDDTRNVLMELQAPTTDAISDAHASLIMAARRHIAELEQLLGEVEP